MCPASPDEVRILRSIRDARFAIQLTCVHCDSAGVQRWGTFSGRQRYRCVACHRTFSDLTGTPLAWTKRLRVWPDFLRCWQQSDSVRRTAAALAVHTTTAFRWRHLLCDTVREGAPRVQGWTECMVLPFCYSAKGQRNETGDGGRARSRSEQRQRARVSTILLHDRQGTVAALMFGSRRPSPGVLREALRASITGTAALLSLHRRFEPIATAAAALRIPHIRVARAGSPDALVHVENVMAYSRRLQVWLERFRGVATSYLPNYLAWHRELEWHDPQRWSRGWLAQSCRRSGQQSARTECDGAVEKMPPGLRPRAPAPRADHPDPSSRPGEARCPPPL